MDRYLIQELRDPESRKSLAEMISSLFERWLLDTREQLDLLGLEDPEELAQYRHGEPLADDPHLLERAGHLLAIDRMLRDAYPELPDYRDRWIKTPGALFHDRSPLELVRRMGLQGLRAVRRQLELKFM